MTQKKHRISPEDIDLKELRKRLKKKQLISQARYEKKRLKNNSAVNLTVCGTCVGWCNICLTIFPKGKGRNCCCPCAVYIQKDVAHVVKYLLLNLKI